ncbi:hypothetical protein NC651_015217 [Populus alba x Populus x berolinensis]|nr:hypothetical protein NC651_015217 [Populus alba x Populus x berolinensis]
MRNHVAIILASRIIHNLRPEIVILLLRNLQMLVQNESIFTMHEL